MDESEWKRMLSKETFCKALKMIREQEELDHNAGEALTLALDNYVPFTSGGKYLEALLLVLKEAVNDKYEYISWWLYDTHDYRVWSADETQEWDLREPAALYDFIAEETDKPTTR